MNEMIGMFAAERPFPLCSLAAREVRSPNPDTHRPVAADHFRRSGAVDQTAEPDPLRPLALRRDASKRADSA